MSPEDFVIHLQEVLEPHRNPQQAASMAAYMKDQFPFLGLPSPDRLGLCKPLLRSAKPYISSSFLHRSGRLLWELPEREYQYTAVELLIMYVKHLEASSLEVVEQLVLYKPWWDSIDPLASNVVGQAIPRFPEWLKTLDEWSLHPNFWLRRMAILYQRSFKNKTDAKRLFGYCLANASNKEFFIRKAIGWALREYSKTNPEAVRDFIEQHHSELSALSLREGSKYL